jgi:hut operon positive regulator
VRYDVWDQITDNKLGKSAMILALLQGNEQAKDVIKGLNKQGFLVVTGKVGSMELHKVVAAIETASKSQGIIDSDLYREEHALYHAILESLQGVGRGELSLGTILRTVGLSFAVVRGPLIRPEEGEWLAVALYGTIGAPIKGLEHEALGLGINHI